jgi:hypothetical protein
MAIQHKFKKGESLFSTTLSASISTGTGETITLASVSGLPTDTEITITVDRVDANGNDTPAKLERITGTISGSNLTSYTRGTDGTTEQSHSSGAVVEYIWNSQDWNDAIDGILVGHNQDGTHDPAILYDTNGNEEIKFTTTASAVNEITVTNAATGNAPELSATGGDTNIDLKLKGKGTGHAQAYDNESASYFDLVPNYSMSRQAIMNGNFDVWQRGTSYSSGYVDNTPYYLCDRWRDSADDDGGTRPTLTRSRQTLTAGDIPNAYYYSRLAANGTGTSLGASSGHGYLQSIEHGTRMLCGLNKKVTISFWARSDIANKRIGTYIVQDYGSGGTPTTAETITGTNWTLTSTWTKYTHTFTTNTLVGKTFGTANDDVLKVALVYVWGTTTDANVGATTAETYGNGYVDIAQVQLCAGEVALPFQPKSFEEELRACQRYYIRVGGTNTLEMFGSGHCATTTTVQAIAHLPVAMRIPPTLETSGTAGDYTVRAGAASVVLSSVPAIATNGSGKLTVNLDITVASGLTAGNGAIVRATSTANAYLGYIAEL